MLTIIGKKDEHIFTTHDPTAFGVFALASQRIAENKGMTPTSIPFVDAAGRQIILRYEPPTPKVSEGENK